VGFTVSGYDWRMALAASLIIAAVTFALCAAGVLLGRRFGTRLAGKAQWLGGSILIAIGIEILITGLVG
jgi:putative Mn2+ efflux pump MntP